MNLADLKDRVFRLTNHTYQDTHHMRDLINGALISLSNEAKLEGVQTYPITAGNASYALPSGYKSARALVEGTLDNPNRIFNLVAIDETREGYAVWGGELVLKPTPSQDMTLNFYFYKYATELLNDTDEADAEFTSYGDVIASYAAAMILSLPGASEVTKGLIDRYFGIWEEGRQRFRRDRAKTTKQASVRIVNDW